MAKDAHRPKHPELAGKNVPNPHGRHESQAVSQITRLWEGTVGLETRLLLPYQWGYPVSLWLFSPAPRPRNRACHLGLWPAWDGQAEAQRSGGQATDKPHMRGSWQRHLQMECGACWSPQDSSGRGWVSYQIPVRSRRVNHLSQVGAIIRCWRSLWRENNLSKLRAIVWCWINLWTETKNCGCSGHTQRLLRVQTFVCLVFNQASQGLRHTSRFEDHWLKSGMSSSIKLSAAAMNQVWSQSWRACQSSARMRQNQYWRRREKQRKWIMQLGVPLCSLHH